MAVADILTTLEQEASERIAQIHSQAEEDARRIEEESRAEAARLTSERLAAAEAGSCDGCLRVLNAARLQSRRTVASVREELIDAVFNEVERAIAGARQRDDYDAIFSALAEEILAPGPVETIVVAPADVTRAQEVLRGAGIAGEIHEDDRLIAGGLIGVADGGRILRDDSLAARLTRLREVARARVAELLFG